MHPILYNNGAFTVRSYGVLPASMVAPTRLVSSMLTVGAMAALGLGVDLREVRRVGAAVIATVTLSLAMLLALSVTLIHVLGIR